jgi:hypothetical protein
VFGSDEPVFEIESVAVGIAAGIPKGGEAGDGMPEFQFIGGDVAEDQVAFVARNPDGSLDEAHARGELFQLGIRGHELVELGGVRDFKVGRVRGEAAGDGDDHRKGSRFVHGKKCKV